MKISDKLKEKGGDGMQIKRMLTVVIAAALTGGITYAYAAPIRENNTVVYWQLQTGTAQTAEMNTEVGMIYGMNRLDKPVEIYTRMVVAGQTEGAQWIADQVNMNWARTNLNAYDRNGNRVEGWVFDRQGQTVLHLTERYDAHGNCVKQSGLETGDTVTEYTYDHKGRIVSQITQTMNPQTGSVEIQTTSTQTYTDHPDGSYTVQQGDGDIVQEYDATGNLVSQHVDWGTDGRTSDYYYTYDEQNRQIGQECYTDGQLKDRTVVEYDVDGLISRSTNYDSTGAVIGTSTSRKIDGPPVI